MTEPTDEMVQLAVKTFLDAPGVTIREIDAAMHEALAGVLAIVERDQAPTQDAYDAAVRALEKHRQRADRAEAELAEFRDKLAALAAIEDYIGESGENAARNVRDLLSGTGKHDNDPRVQARAWELEWTTTGSSQSTGTEAPPC